MKFFSQSESVLQPESNYLKMIACRILIRKVIQGGGLKE